MALLYYLSYNGTTYSLSPDDSVGTPTLRRGYNGKSPDRSVGTNISLFLPILQNYEVCFLAKPSSALRASIGTM
jgi:hypothetical protein